MGYVRDKVFKLVFDESTGLAGLEVRARSLPIGNVMKLAKYADADGKATAKDQLESADEMIRVFATALIDWNLEQEDPSGGPNVPVPPSLESLYEQDFDMVMEIVLAWMEAVMGVAAPLGHRSSDTARSLEESLPMEMS